MRVLAGGPARETESEMFRLHVEGLEAQDTTKRQLVAREGSVDMDAILKAEPGRVVRVSDVGDVSEITSGLSVTVRHEVVPDTGGPRWHHEKIERVARVRQGFMDEANRQACSICGHDFAYPIHDYAGRCHHPDCECVIPNLPHDMPVSAYDALLMVDTDVILGPGVLEHMWAVDADVVYGVFWTVADWGNAPGIDVWPNVWSHHPYRFDPEVWDALVAPGVNEVEVRGGGACTLIRGRGFESRYWPLLGSLSAFGDMMAGEDRGYNLGLECRGIRQVAVTGLPIVHLYTDAHRTPEMVAEARERVGLFGKVAH